MDWILFVTKKVLASLTGPLGAVLAMWFAACVLWRRRPQSRTAPWLMVAAGIVLLISSMSFTGFLLMRSLEQKAGSYADPGNLSRKGVEFIVVLGGGVRHGETQPVHALACDSLSRLMEGMRLWKQMPGSRLVLSGGRYSSKVLTTAEAMSMVARELGIPPEALILESESWGTEDEARLLKPILGTGSFALVTSAYHMNRSLASFRRMGLNPIAAPVGFESSRFVVDFGCFLPSAAALLDTQRALHEYVGMLWLSVKDLAKRQL
jgi:uncharacterized SAM-binding protein YcdF (DUF218 family)